MSEPRAARCRACGVFARPPSAISGHGAKRSILPKSQLDRLPYPRRNRHSFRRLSLFISRPESSSSFTLLFHHPLPLPIFETLRRRSRKVRHRAGAVPGHLSRRRHGARPLDPPPPSAQAPLARPELLLRA